MANLIVIVRVRDEERNIGTFCEQYSFADRILVADSGSVDRTKEIASGFPKVEIRDFTQKIDRNGFMDVPEASHTTFLIDWAKEYSPDWIISDDADCHPNYLLKEKALEFFDQADVAGHPQININRLYIYKGSQYFPDMNLAGTSLWAWKPNQVNIWVDGDMSHLSYHGFLGNHFDIPLPYCLLHHSWPDDSVIAMKMARWKARGESRREPPTFGGGLMALPDWAHI